MERTDKERLDWLENEVDREMKRPAGWHAASLFCKNQPITRRAIDAAMDVAEEPTGGNE